jgi:hypothetical protein
VAGAFDGDRGPRRGLGDVHARRRERGAVGTNLVGGFWVQGATDEAKRLISDKVGEASFACA